MKDQRQCFRGTNAGFISFLEYYMNIMLGEFNGKLGTDDIFKSTIRNESLYQDRNDNCVRIVNNVTPKNLIVKSTLFLHRNIHKYTWTSHDGKTHKQIDHILMDRRWY